MDCCVQRHWHSCKGRTCCSTRWRHRVLGNPRQELVGIAPVTAVRGNNDHGPWAEKLAETEMLKIGGMYLYVIHDLAQLDIDPQAAGVRVVIAGHSHRPSVRERVGVLFVNPGSAGPRGFRLPVSIGELRIDGSGVTARTIDLLAPNGG